MDAPHVFEGQVDHQSSNNSPINPILQTNSKENFFSKRSSDLSPQVTTFWQANLAGWIIIALFGIFSRVAFFGDWAYALFMAGISDTFGFLLTCGVHLAVRRWLHWPVSAVRMVPLAVLLAFAGGLVQMLLAHQARLHFPSGADMPDSFNPAVPPLIYYTAVFLVWALAYFWLGTDRAARNERLRHSDARSAAARAELEQLRLQLDPHFLFNSLNTVTGEIYDRPAVALEMTRRIAGYLRYLLDRQGQPVCWLAEEIEAVSAYLRIQELRYERVIRCTVAMDEDAGQFPVPHLILQGLVENAVKHGLRPSAATQLHIDLRARMEEGRLVVTVANQGRLGSRGHRRGVGLANIRRRLALHFPDRHALVLSQEGELVVARLILQAPICFA
ncbi:sensor histidine kinase [Ancylobacter oerskovii]|uniref:Sensor histidine kinase n=1 Tax=Ancylobacter oerskovii TaxID=459519 RepID=A0ABW4YTE9_9HYPH|nr:histidine kinase [Ancylobacter oerskovii]MBS7543307.1 histidine kinase [Ancylobacter oerskovii]